MNNKRKYLYPYLKQAKQQKKKAVLVYDKLYIDGQLFVQEEIQNTQRMDTQETPKPTKGKNAQQSGNRTGPPKQRGTNRSTNQRNDK